MKILHCMWSADIGGIERLVLDLADAQKKDGLSVGVLLGRAEGGFLENFEKDGIPLSSIDLKSGLQFSRAKIRAAVEIMRDFDIVHLHAYNPVMASAALRSGKKIVYTEHGNFGFGRKITFRDRIKFWLLGRFLKRVDFLSFNSVFTKSYAESRYNLHSVNRGVVYNGIRFNSSEEPADDQLALNPYQEKLTGNFVVGTTSRFAGFKRVDRLISAFADFAAGKNNVKLLLVGDGPTRPELERMVTAKGMNTQVIFTGFQKQVARFQQAMDVCVFASENEPFGLVAVETLKLGKPTVVFRSGGIAEIIEPICKEDVVESNEQLAERLNDYHGNHRKICEPYEARKEYARRFCISIMSSSFIKIYHEIVG